MRWPALSLSAISSAISPRTFQYQLQQRHCLDIVGEHLHCTCVSSLRACRTLMRRMQPRLTNKTHSHPPRNAVIFQYSILFTLRPRYTVVSRWLIGMPGSELECVDLVISTSMYLRFAALPHPASTPPRSWSPGSGVEGSSCCNFKATTYGGSVHFFMDAQAFFLH